MNNIKNKSYQDLKEYIYKIYRISKEDTTSNDIYLYIRYSPIKIIENSITVYYGKKNREKKIAKLAYDIKSDIMLKDKDYDYYTRISKKDFANNIDYNKLRIFGDKFVKNNKKKCKIIYNNKEIELKEFHKFKNIRLYGKPIIKIYLKLVSFIINIEEMFSNCESLKYIRYFNWDMKYIKNMKYMFNKCINLHTIESIKYWNTKNVVDMSYMFCECKSYVFGIKIDKWNVGNVKNMQKNV